MSRTVDTVIDELGGTLKVSSALGLEKSTVSTWRRRGIPASRWASLVRLASDRGVPDVTFEALSEIPAPAEARA